MNYDERISQCDADIKALKAEKGRLIVAQEESKRIDWKHGDTANSGGHSDQPRLFIEGDNGLMIFEMQDGHQFHTGTGVTAETWARDFGYVRTGNIFGINH